MEIAGCIIISTCVVYLDYVRCSSSGAGSSRVPPHHSNSLPEGYEGWKSMKINGYDVLVEIDPFNEKMTNIRLLHVTPNWVLEGTELVHVIDDIHGFDFVAFESRATGRWLQVGPISEAQRMALEHIRAEILHFKDDAKHPISTKLTL